MRTTNIKFSGMASGMDTDAMVQALTMPYKQKYDYEKQEQLLMEMKKDKMKEVNSQILGFYDKYLGPARLGGTFLTNKVNISHPNLVDIKGSVDKGNHTLNITQVAGGAQVSTESIDGDKKTALVGDTTTTPPGMGFKDGDKITLKVTDKDGKEHVVEATVGQDITGKDGTVRKLTTIEDLEEQINNELNKKLGEKHGVKFKFDEGAKGFIIGTESTGANQKISLEVNNGTENDKLSKLGIKKMIAEDGTEEYNYVGKDAKLTYNGISFSSATNTVKLDGLEFTIKGISNEPITIASTADSEGMYEFITGFVDGYNKLIEDLHGMIDAPYNKSYRPLTDEQKKDMSESDIKLWNEKIEKSLFRNDPVLRELTTSMRSIMGSVVGGNELGTLSEIGINTGANYKEKGKLYIDEEKLKAAIDKNPEEIMNLFSSNGNESVAKEKYLAENPSAVEGDWERLKTNKDKTYDKYMNTTLGIGDRLYNEVSKMLKGSTNKSANFMFNDKTLDKQIREQKDEVRKKEEQMYRMEDMYYKRFTAMETALSKLNNQSQSLMSQLGGM